MSDEPDDCARCRRMERRHARERRARLESEAIAERFTRQAMHDPLTGLGNRTLLLDYLETALERARLTSSHLGVLFLDLDDFKLVNDTMGHPAGDRLLMEVADRLLASSRSQDLVARFGGDEFVVVVGDPVDLDTLDRMADRLARCVEEPVDVDGEVWRSRVSIGIRLVTGEDTVASVLRDADAAMYDAKRLGSGRRETFRPATHTALVERVRIDHAVRRAVEAEEIQPWYQPIVDLRTGEVLGAEALARWVGDVGRVPPDVFIEAAERIGALDDLTATILGSACRQTVCWQPADGWLTHVNLHPREVSDPRLPARVAEVLTRTGLPADRLCLELTEQALVSPDADTTDVLHALCDLGVKLAIDDFGVAYSSFGYLKRLPVHLLKIDRSLVQGVGTDPSDRAILRAVVDLAEALDLGVVAEGVETRVQADALSALGVTQAQGWLFSPAVAADGWPPLMGEPAVTAGTSAAETHRPAS